VLGKFTTPFELRSQQDKNFAVYYSETVRGEDTYAKVTSKDKKWRQHFVYDDRTKSIRLAKQKTVALATETGSLKQGKIAVFREWKATADQNQWLDKDGQIKNKARLCLTPRQFTLQHNQLLTWWECGDNKSQLWSNPTVEVDYPEAPAINKPTKTVK